MCGIAGYWRIAGDEPALHQALGKAVGSLHHRGPDASGVWFDDSGVGLGHARLAILDLSPAGAQPMHSHCGRYHIVFNGEIYNHAEIAAELRGLGYVFKGHSDTEMILAAFAQWGSACVNRFIGMFAFAIWDAKLRRMSLCRDRAGVKPLYWLWSGGTLAFASELKALRALPHWQPEIDKTALGEFLQYGYIGQPRSIYAGVRKLTPGCWLHVEADKAPVAEPYWSLRRIAEKGMLQGREQDLEAELEELLGSAFRYRLVSDVPVGLFLSGGIDSSLVAGILRKSNVEIETFTIGFESERHDERAAAAAVASALGLKNHTAIASESEAERILAKWPDLYDEPFGDHSGIPTYLVSCLAREKVSVALSADGGDELFCGYAGYALNMHKMASHARIPAWARVAGGNALGWAAGLLPSPTSGAMGGHLNRLAGGGMASDRMHKLSTYIGAPTGIDSLRAFFSVWQPREISRLLGTAYADPRTGAAPWPGAPAEQIAAFDFHEFLPDDVLAKADRATMAVGLEGREPMLDHRIVEMAFRLPLSMRMGPLGNKHVLRSILYRHVPRHIVDRPKQGFAVPIASWMTRLIESGAVSQSNALLAERLNIDRRALDGAATAFASSEHGKNRLWLLYVLGQWAQRWM